jgi:hypothetical protein
MSSPSLAPGIYLTGSVNQPTVADTFRLLGTRLQPGAARIPDGEPGERANWVFTQTAHFHENDQLERLVGDLVRPKPGVDPGAIAFPRFRYADDAIASYAEFRKAKEDGVVAPETRLLVSIPTPLNTLSSFVAFEHRLAVLPAYEAETKKSIDEIQAAIPHDELAIQFDLPTEVATIEGWFENPFASHEAILESVARLAEWVEDDVELTFHLCYGDSKFGASPFMGTPPDPDNDPGGRHIFPRDTSTIVYVSNGLSRLIGRRIDAIQAATVRTWTRSAHWAPLAGLALEPDTQFFLGLVHTEDGVDGAQRRIALAGQYLDEFGVSTECGLGRHSPEQLEEAVEIFRALVVEPAKLEPAVA